MRREEITASLVEAFRRVDRDDAFTLHEAQLADQGLRRVISAKELADAKRLDPQQDWQEIPTSSLEECDAALAHLSPVGWRFYIPAYMLHALALLEEGNTTSRLPTSVVFHLTLHKKTEAGLRRYNLERFGLLDETQVNAVASFLRYVMKHATEDTQLANDARVALARYWDLPAGQRPNNAYMDSSREERGTP